MARPESRVCQDSVEESPDAEALFLKLDADRWMLAICANRRRWVAGAVTA